MSTLDELRALFKTDVDAQKTELETPGPLCTCCKQVSESLIEHPTHGQVCFWCRTTCYDILADRFDHARADAKVKDAIAAARCEHCGHMRELVKNGAIGATDVYVWICTACQR